MKEYKNKNNTGGHIMLVVRKNNNPFNEMLNAFHNAPNNHLYNDIESERYFYGKEIIENEKDFELKLLVPGLEKENLNIELHEETMEISVIKNEKEQEEENNQAACYNSKRRFHIPENIARENIEADLKNGILKITLPKIELEVSKPLQIDIK